MIVREGHVIQNHSGSHPDLSRATDGAEHEAGAERYAGCYCRRIPARPERWFLAFIERVNILICCGRGVDRSSLGISKSELANAKKIVNEENMQIYGVRFENDCLSHSKKRDTLKAEFGARYIDASISTTEYMTSDHCQAKDCSKAHSTLIGDWKDKSSPSQSRRQEVVEYLKNPSTFNRRLRRVGFFSPRIRVPKSLRHSHIPRPEMAARYSVLNPL
jgi:hypothetical protein